MRGVAVCLSILACAPGSALNPQPADDRTPAQLFNSRWTGHTEDDVLMQYGTPTETIVLSSGNRVRSYHREVFQASSESSAYVGAYGGGQGASSFATTIYCDRRFEIDKTASVVVRAVITGSRCDFSR